MLLLTLESQKNPKPIGAIKMKEKIMKFLRDEDGLTTVEYAVAGALVAAAVVAAFTALGGEVGTTIDRLTGILSTANTAT
jgi:pilus assembly protein Flp/PilA